MPQTACVPDALGAVVPAEVLPLLYPYWLSSLSSDFGRALEQFGTDAGPSWATVTRLGALWQDESCAFNDRSLPGTVSSQVW